MEYAEAHEIIRKGAKVLHDRSVFLAEKNGLPLHVLPFSGDHQAQGTLIGRIPRVNKSVPLYEEPMGVSGGVSG
jgi:aspartokinase